MALIIDRSCFTGFAHVLRFFCNAGDAVRFAQWFR